MAEGEGKKKTRSDRDNNSEGVKSSSCFDVLQSCQEKETLSWNSMWIGKRFLGLRWQKLSLCPSNQIIFLVNIKHCSITTNTPSLAWSMVASAASCSGDASQQRKPYPKPGWSRLILQHSDMEGHSEVPVWLGHFYTEPPVIIITIIESQSFHQLTFLWKKNCKQIFIENSIKKSFLKLLLEIRVDAIKRNAN